MNISLGRAVLWALFACAGLADAHAQTRGRVLPVDEMAQKCEVIGVATVKSLAPRLEERTGMISTDFTLSFTEIWKGEPTPPFVLVKPGGRIGQDAVTLPGHEYILKAGEEVVVFAVPMQFGNHSVMGIRQGLYRVGQGPDHPLFRVSDYPESAGKSSPLTLQALKDEVRRALGRPVESRPTPPPKESSAGAGSGGTADAPSVPAPPAPTEKVPAASSEPEHRSWAGLIILFLLLAVGIGVIISRRKPGLKR